MPQNTLTEHIPGFEYRATPRKSQLDIFEGLGINDHIALAVAVESGPIRYPAMIDPFPGDNQDFMNYFFYVPGMQMQIYIGDGVRESSSAKYCINVNPQYPILLVPLAKDMRGFMAKHSAAAYKTEKLHKTTAQIEARGLSVKLGD
jgi:hypothetical protein